GGSRLGRRALPHPLRVHRRPTRRPRRVRVRGGLRTPAVGAEEVLPGLPRRLPRAGRGRQARGRHLLRTLTMPLATFALDGADPTALRFPVAQLPRRMVDGLRTLLQLDGIDAGIPLLIEERYLQERDGLNLLLRLRLEPALAASRAPVFVRLRKQVENHV